jgi:hypothetical protein
MSQNFDPNQRQVAFRILSSTSIYFHLVISFLFSGTDDRNVSFVEPEFNAFVQSYLRKTLVIFLHAEFLLKDRKLA